MFRKTKTLITTVVLLVSIMSNSVHAQTGYFNNYTGYESLCEDSYYTTMEGMCIDRNNNWIYVAKHNKPTGKSQLFAINMKASTVEEKLLINSDTNSSSYDLGHANDLTVVASEGDTTASVYVAPMSDGQYTNKIIKLSVTPAKNTYKVAKTYTLTYNGVDKSIGGITYSVGTGKFILRSGGDFFIGTFNDTTGKFDIEATFRINRADAIVNNATLDTTDNYYSQQGISFYQGNLYVPLSKKNPKDDSATNVSVILTYPLDINAMINEQSTSSNEDFSEVLKTNENLSFRITSSEYDVFEIESVDFDDGTLYFNTNRALDNSQKDMIATFDDYNYYK